MSSTQTLHDFVLNLLTNPDARSAFELDPEGTLNAAGLSDITAADVQDVVPLVVDYAPVQGVADLAPAVGELGIGQLGSDPLSAIGQLQSVTQQLGVGSHSASADVNVAALGAISVDPANLAVGASALGGIGVGVSEAGVATDLSGAADVATTLDSDVVDPTLSNVTGTVGGVDTLVAGVGSTEGALGTVDFATNTVTGTLGTATGVVDGLGVGDTLDSTLDGGVTGHLPALGGVDDVTSTVGGVTGGVSDTVDGVTGVDLGAGLGVHGEAHASADGVLGLTDGLL